MQEPVNDLLLTMPVSGDIFTLNYGGGYETEDTVSNLAARAYWDILPGKHPVKKVRRIKAPTVNSIFLSNMIKAITGL